MVKMTRCICVGFAAVLTATAGAASITVGAWNAPESAARP